MPGMELDKGFPIIGAALEIGPGQEPEPGVKADGALPQHPPVAVRIRLPEETQCSIIAVTDSIKCLLKIMQAHGEWP